MQLCSLYRQTARNVGRPIGPASRLIGLVEQCRVCATVNDHFPAHCGYSTHRAMYYFSLRAGGPTGIIDSSADKSPGKTLVGRMSRLGAREGGFQEASKAADAFDPHSPARLPA